MEKKKIAILGVKYFPSQGGTSRVVEDIIQQLHDEYHFTMYCYEDPRAEGYIKGVDVVQFKPYPFGVIGVFFFFLRCARHMLKHGDYDIVHIHKTDAAFFINMLAKRFKVIATSHEAPYKRDKWSGATKAYFKWMEKVFMQSKAKLTCISEPLSVYYEENFGRKVQYIPNGVEAKLDTDFDLADAKLAEYGIDGPFVFFAARRVMATKGPHHMLKALKKINYDGHIVIAGDTDQLPAFTKELQNLAKGMKVHFIGFVNGKAMLMAMIQRAGVFVFPSETEGMSIMLLEVASMGTPVIASDIPENTAVFSDKELLFFENKNADDLAEKFQWASNNWKAMEERAEAAKSRVQNEYDRALIAQNYDKLYTEVAEAPVPSAV
ncbi:MAG: glycosyltransferase family 4 protein [Bacteroidota bacterium]